MADDQALVRGSLRVLIETTPGMIVVGEAGTGSEAVELAASERPDVVLMDIRMPEMDGIEATRRIVSSSGDGRCRVLVLTTFDLDAYVYAALRAGASGFLLKDAPPAELLAAIRVVAAGDALLSPRVTRRLIEAFARLPDPARPGDTALAGLTDRGREVLLLVASGRSNAEIAERLAVSPATVKTHVGHLLGKLDARDRSQLVIAAYEAGLARPAAAGPRLSRSREVMRAARIGDESTEPSPCRPFLTANPPRSPREATVASPRSDSDVAAKRQ